ncbi:cellulose biosynthesis protein BcsN [Rhizobium halophytocola]|uniref:cellulose biosynthesis protein BcsN n=1 Tax=Rhizobium halophytocola TaxID=735519 RepID=UPI00315856C1
MLKNASVLLLCLAISACTSTSGVRHSNGPELVENTEAFIMPPPGGPAMVGVVERQYSNGVDQTVSLATASSVPGDNYLKVRFVGGGGPDGAPTLGFQRFTETGMSREMARAAPGVAMRRASTFLQNAYGPFSYASGRSRGGDTCIYAWQQIRSRSGGIGRDLGMIQVRARLCDTDASERELLNVMYGFTITGSFGGKIWNPYGLPSAVDTSIGAVGKPVYPDAPKTVAISYGHRTPAPVRVRVVSAPKPRATAAKADAAVITGPRVPLPGSAGAPSAASAGGEDAGGQTPPQATVTVPSPACMGANAKTPACN